MTKKPIIIADSDAIIALVIPKDSNHKKAKEIVGKLVTLDAIVLTPMTAITETITTLQRKLKRPDLAKRIAENVQQGTILLIDSQKDDYTNALTYFNPSGSKNNTFFDAVIAGTAKRYKAAAIFSFDKWYKKLGFTLAEEYIK